MLKNNHDKSEVQIKRGEGEGEKKQENGEGARKILSWKILKNPNYRL